MLPHHHSGPFAALLVISQSCGLPASQMRRYAPDSLHFDTPPLGGYAPAYSRMRSFTSHILCEIRPSLDLPVCSRLLAVSPRIPSVCVCLQPRFQLVTRVQER